MVHERFARKGEDIVLQVLQVAYASHFLHRVWVAEDEGEIVSTVGVCFYNYPPTFRNATGKIAYLTNVYTKDEYRNRGIATDLLKHIMDEIKAEKCGITRLHASSQGRRMYEKMGFTDDEGFMSLKNE